MKEGSHRLETVAYYAPVNGNNGGTRVDVVERIVQRSE